MEGLFEVDEFGMQDGGVFLVNLQKKGYKQFHVHVCLIPAFTAGITVLEYSRIDC